MGYVRYSTGMPIPLNATASYKYAFTVVPLGNALDANEWVGAKWRDDPCVEIWVKMDNFWQSYDCFSEPIYVYYYVTTYFKISLHFTKMTITLSKIGHCQCGRSSLANFWRNLCEMNITYHYWQRFKYWNSCNLFKLFYSYIQGYQ